MKQLARADNRYCADNGYIVFIKDLRLVVNRDVMGLARSKRRDLRA